MSKQLFGCSNRDFTHHPLTFRFMEIAKDFRVGFVKHVDLLQQTYEKRFVVQVGSVRAVLLLLIDILVVVFVQLVLGARFIWSLAIIRCAHRDVRCVVDQQIVKTETAEKQKKKVGERGK